MSHLETRVLQLLDRGPQTARELAEGLGIRPESIWNILRPLRDEGLIEIAHIKLRGKGSGSGRGVAIYQRTPRPEKKTVLRADLDGGFPQDSVPHRETRGDQR